MANEKLANLSTSEDPGPTAEESPSPSEQSPPENEPVSETEPPWYEFAKTASQSQVAQRIIRDLQKIVESEAALSHYCFLLLFDSIGGIGSFELDRVYSALRRINPKRDRDVLLTVLSLGGEIEPAYQISKICKSYCRERFVVAIPRYAKSAATLIALGADQIHMGPLGQLGPIDPQISGLPALGVAQALDRIARLAAKHPESSEMFSRYLRMVLRVEQIGYCERVVESAVQYAERLLATKQLLASDPHSIAMKLVHEYKDHGFVIDLDEARSDLGEKWVLTDTPELTIAERFYGLFDEVIMFLRANQKRRVVLAGAIEDWPLIMDVK